MWRPKASFHSRRGPSAPEPSAQRVLALKAQARRTCKSLRHNFSGHDLGCRFAAKRCSECQTGGAARALPPSYSYPRVIHRSEESPQELLPAASVNNSARKILPMSSNTFFPQRENTHRPATNSPSWRESTPNSSPSSRAMCWSLTNTQWWTALSRSHYKTFAGISQRVFSKN